jgi:hypothetical protein
VEESLKQLKWLPEGDFIAPPYVEVDKVSSIKAGLITHSDDEQNG